MEFPQFVSKKRNLYVCQFGFVGFKEFIIQDDQKIISMIFYGVEKFDKKNHFSDAKILYT